MKKLLIVSLVLVGFVGFGAQASASIVSHPAGCPRVAFCGCGVMKRLGLNDRSLYLAANYLRKFPRAIKVAAGMVAARVGHVFYIEKVVKPGLVLAYDPNSGGHQTRLHLRSLAGFSVRDPHGVVVHDSRHVRTVSVLHHRKRFHKVAVLNRMVVYQQNRFAPL